MAASLLAVFVGALLFVFCFQLLLLPPIWLVLFFSSTLLFVCFAHLCLPIGWSLISSIWTTFCCHFLVPRGVLLRWGTISTAFAVILWNIEANSHYITNFLLDRLLCCVVEVNFYCALCHYWYSCCLSFGAPYFLPRYRFSSQSEVHQFVLFFLFARMPFDLTLWRGYYVLFSNSCQFY